MNRFVFPLPLFLLCFVQDQIACDVLGAVSFDETDAMTTVIYNLKKKAVLSAVLILALKCDNAKLLKAKAPVMLQIPFKRTTKRPTIEAQNYYYVPNEVFNTLEIHLREDEVVYLLSEDLYNQIMKFKPDSVVQISYNLPQNIAQNRWSIEDNWQQIDKQKASLKQRVKDAFA